MHSLAALAKTAVETYIEERKVIKVINNLSKEIIGKKAGVFITIKKDRNLRGCIGTYLPTKENIADEIIQNAIAAATEDYRFGPIQKNELPFLSYSVYILEKPEFVKDIKDLTKFSEKELKQIGLDPQKYGIIIKTLNHPLKSALLLPDLEGIDTVEKQISITCQKGGIDPSKEKIMIYKFRAKEFTEENKNA